MDYDAMTRRVLARAGEYEKRKKNRRKTALRVGVPALCVLAVGIGVVHASLRASRAWKEWTELVMIAEAPEQSTLQHPEGDAAPLPEEPDAKQPGTVEEPVIGEGPPPEGDIVPEMLYIPEIELPEPEAGAMADMIGLVVWNGDVYTQAQGYTGADAERVLPLAAKHLGRARGNIDEWSTQDDYATELASTCTGEIYTVSGYDTRFRLCAVDEMTLEDGTTVPWVWFMERLNGISLGTGADLFDARLCLPGRIESVRYQTHDDWNEGRNNFQALDDVQAAERLIEAACAGQFEYVHDEQPDFYSREGKQLHLYLTLTDGTVTELRLFEGGWVGYQPLGWYFVKIPGETVEAVFDAAGL